MYVSFDDIRFLRPGFATERDFLSIPFRCSKPILETLHNRSVPFYIKQNGKYIKKPRQLGFFMFFTNFPLICYSRTGITRIPVAQISSYLTMYLKILRMNLLFIKLKFLVFLWLIYSILIGKSTDISRFLNRDKDRDLGLK